jgi:tRNA (guanine-N7-)-methyltransferase
MATGGRRPRSAAAGVVDGLAAFVAPAQDASSNSMRMAAPMCISPTPPQDGSAPSSVSYVKLPPDRLYGRSRGHRLRVRQQRLLTVTLPRLAVDPAALPAFPKIWLEVGFGSGEHTLAQIATHPTTLLIACEVFENGFCSLLSRLVPEGAEATTPLPANLRIWPHDARALLRVLPNAALERLFLLFPDPWPKARHAKRRFVHPAQLGLVARVLKPGAEWRVASDDPVHQAWIGQVMSAQNLFEPTIPSIARPPGWPPTRYEAKALAAGRRPLYWSFMRRS